MTGRLLVRLAVRLLPVRARRRYASELDAELSSLPPRRRLGYGLSVLAGAPRLRWHLLSGARGGPAVALCFIGFHRSARYRPNPDDPSVFALRCTRCGRERDPRQYGQGSGEGVAWGNVYVSGGG